MSVAKSELTLRAEEAEGGHRWADASALFLQLAHAYKDEKKYEEASRFFMRAATAGERSQDWRKLGQVWVQCAAAARSRSHGAVADVDDATDATHHYFPTLDHHAWTLFSQKERVGRAYRNAAYHLERGGSNQTAYVQYRLSAEVFRDAGLPEEASRSYFHALMSFIERHGELDKELFEGLRDMVDQLLGRDFGRYVGRGQSFYRRIAGMLVRHGNGDAASKVVVCESELQRKAFWRERKVLRWITYTVWRATSNYGTNLRLWTTWACGVFFVLFPCVYMWSGTLVWREQWHVSLLDYVFYSLAVVTTSVDLSFSPGETGKLLVLVEALLGVVLMGSFLSLLGRRFLR